MLISDASFEVVVGTLMSDLLFANFQICLMAPSSNKMFTNI